MLLSRWRRQRDPVRDGVTYCESCAQVCDAACRSDGVRERAQVQMLRYRPGMP